MTHGHIDHIGGLAEVKEGTGAEVVIHSEDAERLKGGESRTMSSLFGIAFKATPPADRLLEDGDSIDVGDLHFQVIHTPGHSPGGICLFGHGILLSGDTLFNSGIGRTDFPGCSYSQILNSINTRLLVLPEETKVYPGHGPETTIGSEAQSNPFLRGF